MWGTLAVGQYVGDLEGSAEVAVGGLVRGDVHSGGLVLGSGLARAKEACAEGARRVFARHYPSTWTGEVGVFSVSSSIAAGGGETGKAGGGCGWFSNVDADGCCWR